MHLITFLEELEEIDREEIIHINFKIYPNIRNQNVQKIVGH